MCQMIVGIVIHVLDHIWTMIPKHISFSLYKYFESIKKLRQNGQILSFFHFSSIKNGKSMNKKYKNFVQPITYEIIELIFLQLINSSIVSLPLFLKWTFRYHLAYPPTSWRQQVLLFLVPDDLLWGNTITFVRW